MSTSCCPTSVMPCDFADSKYVPQGNMKCEYTVLGSATPKKRSVLLVADIFGFHPETLKFADEIAKRGNYRVVVPDFFAKTAENPLGPWPMDAQIPSDERWAAFYSYMIKPSTYKSVAGEAARLKEQDGAAPLLIGFCWGANMIARIAAEDQGLAAAISCPHPSFFSEDLLAKIKAPAAVFPSKDEDKTEMNKIKAKLEALGLLGAWIDCDKVHHGFAAARFDAASEECQKAREEVIAATVEFFQKFE
jgi:dienelactone hydrolase